MHCWCQFYVCFDKPQADQFTYMCIFISNRNVISPSKHELHEKKILRKQMSNGPIYKRSEYSTCNYQSVSLSLHHGGGN